METRIKDVVSYLESGFDDVRMIGIKGIGGGGKTTLARVIFDQISIRFDGKSFVENVRESSKSFGLKSLQKQVISDILNDRGITVSSVHDGINMMKKIMCGRKVLVVLDDVDHIDQLEALAGESNWFKPGSIIIITTRDEQVLVAHKVKLIHDVNLLSNEEAICLLSRSTFGRDIPIQGYEELSRQVVRYAAGLPLTIRVLGAFLCGKNDIEWKDALERLKKIPLKETLEKLELSYTGLEDDYKEIFLDVACILKGWRKDDAIIALESCGFHARNGLRVLEQKSLITFSISNHVDYLVMHDHLVEIGKNIVRRLHPDEPNKHSRLWIEDEIEDILANDLGTETTRYMVYFLSQLDPEIVMKGLGNMKKLRFLFAHSKPYEAVFHSHWKFDEVSQYFPNALQILNWTYYPFCSLPNTFQANNLVALKMERSSIVQLWEGGEKKVLNKLRFLHLDNSKLQTLDLGMTLNLEMLSLSGCALVKLSFPLQCLKLTTLNLCHSMLRTLALCPTPNLEMLNLSGCRDLVKLSFPLQCLKLTTLNLCHSKLKTLELRQTPNLEMLFLGECHDLEEIHMPFGCPKLRIFNLSHSKLRTFDFRLTPNIECIRLKKCYHLVELQAPVGCLNKLTGLKLSGLRFKPFLFKKSLKVGSSCELFLVVESLDICPLHPNNNFPKFQFRCVYEEHVPSSIGNVEKLISGGLCASTNLKSLFQSICGLRYLTKLTLKISIPKVPKDLDQLQCLEELNLCCSKIKHLPNNICMLKHLKSLELKRCWLLEKLPEDLGRLECLEKLILSDCTSLRDIPNSICKMKYLRYINLYNCFLVEKLPEELGHLKCLEELNIDGTCISNLPQSIFLLKCSHVVKSRSLRIVGSRLLLESCGFTSEIQSSEDQTFCYI